MKKLSVCVLFGGMSPEHEVSLRSAESVLNQLDKQKYNLFPVGITKRGDWILYGGEDYSALPGGVWETCPENRRAAISPVRGQGLLSFEGDCVVREHIDVVFPVLHGEHGAGGDKEHETDVHRQVGDEHADAASLLGHLVLRDHARDRPQVRFECPAIDLRGTLAQGLRRGNDLLEGGVVLGGGLAVVGVHQV